MPVGGPLASWKGSGASAATAGPYEAQAVRFDGTNDYATRGADLDGAADSKLLTGSGWIRKQGSNGVLETVIVTANLGFDINKSVSDSLTILVDDPAGGPDTLHVESSDGTVEVADGWVHFMFSFDMNDTAKRHLYINDVSDLVVTRYDNDLLDLTYTDWGLGAETDGDAKLDGDLADIAIWFGVYLDLSVEANRRLFIDANGKPVDLGSDGTAPGLGTPIMYFSKRGSDVADDFVTNKGDGGGFTLTGALVDSATSPSD